MSIADRLRTIPSLTGTAPGLDLDALPSDPHERGWAFAGTASSRKAQQLAANPAAALSLWWQPQMRAVRVRGPVVAATPQECEADLAARSPQARAVPPGEWRGLAGPAAAHRVLAGRTRPATHPDRLHAHRRRVGAHHRSRRERPLGTAPLSRLPAQLLEHPPVYPSAHVPRLEVNLLHPPLQRRLDRLLVSRPRLHRPQQPRDLVAQPNLERRQVLRPIEVQRVQRVDPRQLRRCIRVVIDPQVREHPSPVVPGTRRVRDDRRRLPTPRIPTSRVPGD